MDDRYNPSKRTIGEILTTTSARIEVPEWQRDFAWESTQIDQFWTDLIAFSEQYPEKNIETHEYFLGSTVVVERDKTVSLLLDGQQRLATATIVLSVIRDFLAEYDQNAATRTAQKYIVDYDDAKKENRYTLTLSVFDREYFRSTIQDLNVPEPPPEQYSHKLIKQARDYFRSRFEQKYAELGRGQPAADWALRIRQVLTDHMSVVVVSSTDEDSAAAVFETLNDRGIGLSTPDLLRNLLLRRSAETARETILDCWKDVLEVGDGDVHDFLRHYWLSCYGDVKSRSLYRVIKQQVLAENRDSLEFSRDLQRSAQIYRDIIAARDSDDDLVRYLQAIQALNAKSLLPAVLSAYDVGNAEQRKLLLSALISLFVRHSVIGNRENSRLESVVFELAKKLRAAKDFDSAVSAIRTFAPSDDEFRHNFGSAQVSRQATARYLLQELEHQKRETQELSVETPSRVHVEHIYPRIPEGDKWPNHLNVVNRIGNLTLLSRSINTAIKNKRFKDKRPEYEKSDLLLTQEVSKASDWDLAAIEERQKNLAELAPAIWAV